MSTRTSRSRITCPSCGETVLPGSRFCAGCGADVRVTQESAATLEVVPRDPAARRVASGSVPRQEELQGLLASVTGGEFEILTELGRGGMATVFLARDIVLDRKVAIKVMSPLLFYGDGMTERFKREARTAAQLSHPHIIPIHAVRETEQLVYIVMSFVEGRGLDSIIKELGQLPIRMVQTILAHVGGALDYAHRHNVVHRDIKPGNIMIDQDGWAVVTDFGIAQVGDSHDLTATGTAVGTPFYMSPEQCSGQRVGGASDQYSLAVVAYEMLTGKPPFAGGSIMELMQAHLIQAPAPVERVRPDCPVGLARAIARMLAKNPAERWPTIEEALAAAEAKPIAPDDPIHTQMVELGRSGAKLRAASSGPKRPIVRDARTPRPMPNRTRRTSRTQRRRARGSPWVWAGSAAAVVLGTTILLFNLLSVPSAPRQAPTRPAPPSTPPNTALVQVGTSTPKATLSINGNKPEALGINLVRRVPAGKLMLSIAAPTCLRWDTTFTVQANAQVSLGVRVLRCGKVR